MRLPHLHSFPAGYIRRMPQSKETWVRFLRNHHNDTTAWLLLTEFSPHGVFVPSGLLQGAQHTRRAAFQRSCRMIDLNQTEAFDWLKTPKDQTIGAVYNRLTTTFLGVVIPPELVESFTD